MPPVPFQKLAAMLTDRSHLFRRPPLPEADLAPPAAQPRPAAHLPQSWEIGLPGAARPQPRPDVAPLARSVPPPLPAATRPAPVTAERVIPPAPPSFNRPAPQPIERVIPPASPSFTRPQQQPLERIVPAAAPIAFGVASRPQTTPTRSFDLPALGGDRRPVGSVPLPSSWNIPAPAPRQAPPAVSRTDNYGARKLGVSS
jgi:hypothetical protein